MSNVHTTENDEFNAAVAVMRPELHRFLSRMMGSVFDGEDVLQDTLVAALRALDAGTEVENLRSWLFRIGRNTALNAIRARNSERAMKDRLAQFEAITRALPISGGTSDLLRPLMALTPKQRSAVILFDVMGYSAQEVAEISAASVDSVKSTLKRARAALRTAPEVAPDPLSDQDKALLDQYATCFNVHDFDTIRAMLADEVALDLVSIEHRKGAASVGSYFTNYSKATDWLMVPGHVDGAPTVLVFDREHSVETPHYVIRLTFDMLKIQRIQDFRYARYVMQEVTWQRL